MVMEDFWVGFGKLNSHIYRKDLKIRFNKMNMTLQGDIQDILPIFSHQEPIENLESLVIDGVEGSELDPEIQDLYRPPRGKPCLTGSPDEEVSRGEYPVDKPGDRRILLDNVLESGGRNLEELVFENDDIVAGLGRDGSGQS